MDAIDLGLVLNLHQPPGIFDELLERNEWEANEIWWAPDRIPRSLWADEDVARVNLSRSGTLLETLADPGFQELVYGGVDCGSLLWQLQNTRTNGGVAGAQVRFLAQPATPNARGEWSGIARAWLALIRASMRTLAPAFSARRMLGGYVDRKYVPTGGAL